MTARIIPSTIRPDMQPFNFIQTNCGIDGPLPLFRDGIIDS